MKTLWRLKLEAAFILICVMLFFVSCEKEKQEPPPPPSTGLLHQLKSGSSTTTYYHNALNRIVRITQAMPFSDSITFELTRNSAGELVHVREDYGGGDIEQTNVVYKPSTNEVLYYVHTDGTLKDSNIVTYNAGLITIDHYPFDENTQQYRHAAKTSYEFQNGNLARLKQYYMGLAQPHRQVDFTYDTKKSPFHHTVNDVVILGMAEAYLKNNLLRSDVSFPTNLSQPYYYTYQHTYNAIDNPSSTIVKNSRDNSSEQVDYIYK